MASSFFAVVFFVLVGLRVAGGNCDESTPPCPNVTRLVVKVEGLRNNKGVVAVNLFRGAAGFPDDDSHAFAKQVVPIASGGAATATVTFSHLPPGEWAVVLLHDENQNGKMDTGLFGIPKEGFGASNNPKARTGPPRFHDASFVIALGETERIITIKPIYMGRL